MNVIYDIADIRISEVHTARVEVPRWEVPVLQVIHGNDIKVVGQKVVERAVPQPAVEFQRLADRYGPKNEDLPAVAAVYGNYGPGTQALRNEIRDSLTSANETPSGYKSPDARKLEAEKNAADGGQSIAEEAKAKEDAENAARALLDAANANQPADDNVKPTEPASVVQTPVIEAPVIEAPVFNPLEATGSPVIEADIEADIDADIKALIT